MNSQFNEKNVQRIKDEMRRNLTQDGSAEDNPIRTCMRIMFEAASERDPSRRAELALGLSKFLTRPDGLINLFLAVIDFDPSSQIQTTYNQRFMAIANIIAFLPKLCMPYVQYCENLSRQLQPLITHRDEKYSSLSCLIFKSLYESPHAQKIKDDVRDALLTPLIFPLKKKDDESQSKPHHAVLGIHHLIINRMPTKLFAHLFPNLFHALVALHDSPSQLKNNLRTILVRILKDLKPGPACCLIAQTLFHTSELPIYNLVAEDEQVTLKLIEESGPMPEFEKSRQVIVELLEHSKEELLILEFFFHFQGKMWTCGHSDMARKCATLIEPLLEQTDKIDLLTSLLSNLDHALDSLSKVLFNYLEFIKLEKDQKDIINPSVKSTLDILEVLSSTMEIKNIQLLNTLIEIKSIHGPDVAQNLDPLIDKLRKKPEHQVRSVVPANPDYDEAMRDLDDQLVPVRVHALVKLKSLIITGDKYTVSRIPHLFNIIESSLADQDSYVFLASIDLMSEMALRETSKLLPRLMSLYTKQDLGVQQRINVGEVMARLTRKMNEMTPFYAEQVMGIFLSSATRSDDELVRMSSLTNIGEICRNLGNSLGKYLLEILGCVEQILKDETLEIKSASIDLLRVALMGLDAKNIESIQREINSLYQLLKKLRQSTIDDTFCLQVNLALDEIDRLAKDMLGCKNEPLQGVGNRMVKNIKVLSLLD